MILSVDNGPQLPRTRHRDDFRSFLRYKESEEDGYPREQRYRYRNMEQKTAQKVEEILFLIRGSLSLD